MNSEQVRFVFTDVGDTLLRNGQLLPEVLTAMYQLSQQGIVVVPVTGASAGAGEAMIRQWPVKLLIAENGAVAYTQNNGVVTRHSWLPLAELQAQQQEVLAMIANVEPRLALASDQPFRLADVAINVAQDNASLDAELINRVVAAVNERGWQYGLSSIHLNIWQANYNKAQAIVRWMHDLLGVDQDELALYSACIGDSPNDAAMFARIPRSFGINGWQNHREDFTDEPAITLGNGAGWGFVELAHKLLAVDYWDEE
ncbi:HAD family hydrolase [Salinibius halmophilus]|uniref:HAD family hydrolase n=1 Tax=Salinibius halmophilus TaxID=1853216 RepID=UPI000E669C14|nr:HAD-IIB family hydrolase [Salinibius halmophilus]